VLRRVEDTDTPKGQIRLQQEGEKQMKAAAGAVSLASLIIGCWMALTASLASAEPDGAKVSVWSGVYTAAQGKRGEQLHASSCASCHGQRLNGAGQPDMPPSPAIAREGFLRKWSGKSVAELFVYVHTKMPPDNPGSLSEQQSIDAIAHIFAISNIPPGDTELSSDSKALAGIVLEAKPK
jgi:mono/diheme cytochrome c family protein